MLADTTDGATPGTPDDDDDDSDALLITFMTSSFIVDGSSDSISVVVDKYLSLLVMAVEWTSKQIPMPLVTLHNDITLIHSV